jgi:hypothetical protein
MSDSAIKEYPEISEFGYIKDGKVYLKGYFEFKDRELGVVRESEEESMRYFVNRYEMVKKKLDSVTQSIREADNKGSYLMKLIHMRTYLAQYNGLGDFVILYNEINDLEDEINIYIEKNREKNYEIKSALLSEASSLKGSTDWKNSAEKFKELKLKWIKTGSAHKEVDDKLTTDFNDALDYFFTRRKSFFDDQTKVMNERLMKYRKLLYLLERINKDGSSPDMRQTVKDLQGDWRNVGNVPKNKIGRMQIQFKRELDKYFNNIKYSAAIKDKPAVDVKRDLLKTVSEMLTLNGSKVNINDVKQIQENWKKLGKQPNHQEDKELNLRFRIVCNELFETYFLEKSTKYFHPDLYRQSSTDQAKLRIDVLNESIKKDEKELEDFQKQHAFVLAQGMRSSSNMNIFQQRNNFVNKLKTKGRILEKLEQELE